MLVDARTVPQGALLATDVCIVGAGAAGITLARALRGSGLDVIVLESGSLTPEAATQALYKGKSTGDPYYPLDGTRIRAFGGSTNHWQGMCRPLDPIDFRDRGDVGGGGWPIGSAAMARWYAGAHEVLGLGPYQYDPAWWDRRYGTGLVQPGLQGGTLATSLYTFVEQPQRFAAQYRPDLVADRSTRLVLRANVVDITAEGGGRRVTGVDVATLTGRRFRVEPRVLVIAAGGLETPRLLLSSSATPTGLGNGHDLVGRYFTEHLHLPVATLLLTDTKAVSQLYELKRRRPKPEFVRDRSVPRRGGVRGAVTFRPEVIEREGLLNFACTLDEIVLRGAKGDSVDAGRVAGFLSNLRGKTAVAPLGVFMRAEQTPQPNSRVTLDDTRDALGTPRMRLAWRIADEDRARLARTLRLLAEVVGREDLGRLRVREGEAAVERVEIEGAHHHMGTTRMASSPRKGVVDADLRVHDVDNCYVVGSSVFTGGYANPTVTIVALALRLAEHLRTVGRR